MRSSASLPDMHWRKVWLTDGFYVMYVNVYYLAVGWESKRAVIKAIIAPKREKNVRHLALNHSHQPAGLTRKTVTWDLLMEGAGRATIACLKVTV